MFKQKEKVVGIDNMNEYEKNSSSKYSQFESTSKEEFTEHYVSHDNSSQKYSHIENALYKDYTGSDDRLQMCSKQFNTGGNDSFSGHVDTDQILSNYYPSSLNKTPVQSTLDGYLTQGSLVLNVDDHSMTDEYSHHTSNHSSDFDGDTKSLFSEKYSLYSI